MNLVEKLTKQKYSAVITRVQIGKPIIANDFTFENEKKVVPLIPYYPVMRFTGLLEMLSDFLKSSDGVFLDPVDKRRHSGVHSGIFRLGASDSPTDDSSLDPRGSWGRLDEKWPATITLQIYSRKRVISLLV